MTDTFINNDNIEFKNGSDIQVKMTATSDMLTLTGDASDVDILGVRSLVGSNTLTFPSATIGTYNGSTMTLTGTIIAVRHVATGFPNPAEMNGRSVFNLDAPAAGDYAANKDYVDAQVGGNSPNGNDGNVQFKNGTSFAGSDDLDWDNTSKELSIGGNITITNGNIAIGIGNISVATGNISTNDNFIAGGTIMSNGSVTGLSDPITAGTQAANKNYVDAQIGTLPSGSDGDVQYKSGTSFAGDSNFNWDDLLQELTVNGNLTIGSGNITIGAGNITTGAGNIITPHTVSAGTVTTGGTSMTSGSVTGLSTPSAGTDAANKDYVDSKFPDYSTSEIVLPRKWYNGKTIYEKIIFMPDLPIDLFTKSYAHGITGVDEFIRISVMATENDTDYFQTPDATSEISADSTNVNFRSRGSSWNDYNGTCTLQYTKT